MAKAKKAYYDYSSDDKILEKVKIILKLWETHKISEIADELSMKPSQVSYIVTSLREHGFHLARKKPRKVYWDRIVQKLNEGI